MSNQFDQLTLDHTYYIIDSNLMEELVDVHDDLLSEGIIAEDTATIQREENEIVKLVFYCTNGNYLELIVDPDDRTYRQGVITTMMDPFDTEAFEAYFSNDGAVKFESNEYEHENIPWFRSYSIGEGTGEYGMAFMEYLSPEKFNRAYKLQHLDHEIDSPFSYYSRVSYLADTAFRESIAKQEHWDPMDWIQDDEERMTGRLEDAFGNTILFEYLFDDDIDHPQPLDIDFVLEEELSYKYEGELVDVIATGTLMTFSFKLGAVRMDIT